MALANTTREKKERAGRMYLMHAADREEIKEAFAGDIVALQGLKDTRTGETLCDPQKPVILEKMDFPNPVIEMKIEPKTKADQEKMAIALSTALEDPSFRLGRPGVGRDDPEGHGRAPPRHQGRHPEAHLRRGGQCRGAAGRLPRDARASGRDRLRTRSRPGTGQFARVKLRLEPNETGKGNEFEIEVVGGTVPKEYIPGVEKGVNSVWDNGVLIGFPMVDMKVTLFDGAYHEVDSRRSPSRSPRARRHEEGCDKAGSSCSSRSWTWRVVTPGEFVGGVIGDINSRRGQIRDQQMRGNATVIRAFVPLANMFGYVSQLRSMSTGRASYTMQFAHYADVPRNVADEVKAKYA